MLNNSMMKAFVDYAILYNQDSNGKETDFAFDVLYRLFAEGLIETVVDEIIDILCKTKDNKIYIAKNLEALFREYNA